MSRRPEIEIKVGASLTEIDLLVLARWEAIERRRLYFDEKVGDLVEELYENATPTCDWETVFVNALVERAVHSEGLTSDFATAVALYLQVKEYIKAKLFDNNVKENMSQNHSWEVMMAQAMGGQPFKSGISLALTGEKLVLWNGENETTKDWTIVEYLKSKIRED